MASGVNYFNFIGMYLWHYRTYIECVLSMRSHCHRVPEEEWVTPWRGHCRLTLGSIKHLLPSAWQQHRQGWWRSRPGCDPYRLLRPQAASTLLCANTGKPRRSGNDNKINHISKAVMTSPKQSSGWTLTLCINYCILSRWMGKYWVPHHHQSQIPAFFFP